MNPWTGRVYLLAGLALALGYLIAGPAGEAVIYGVLGAAAAVAMLTGMLRYRPPLAAVWWLIWTGLLVGLAGDVVLGFSTWVLPGRPMLQVLQNALYLLSYPLIVVGLAVLVRRRTAGGDRGALIDAAIAATSLALVTWLMFIMPVLTAPGLSALALVLGISAPIAEVAIVVLLARLVVGGRARHGSLLLLSAAMSSQMIADLVNAVLTSRGVAETYWGGWLYCLSYVLFGAAALHPSMPSLATPDEAPAGRLTGRRRVVLSGLTLLPPLLLLAKAPGGLRTADAVALAIACIVVFVLVLARMFGLVRRVEVQAWELADLAARDGLTGVGNRRAWDAALAAGIDRAARTGRPLIVALLDLDHFKRYNDTRGHQAGDQLLKGAAAAWLDVLRRGDVLYRYGGEEFALVLPDAAEDAAAEVVDRLRQVMPDGQTFSAGLGRWNGVETSAELLARVDAALYRAKAAGRDRTECTAAHAAV